MLLEVIPKVLFCRLRYVLAELGYPEKEDNVSWCCFLAISFGGHSIAPKTISANAASASP